MSTKRAAHNFWSEALRDLWSWITETRERAVLAVLVVITAAIWCYALR